MTFKQRNLTTLIFGAMVLGACTPMPTGASFSQNETLRPQTVQMGTLADVRSVDIRPGQTRLGTATGAVLGGLAGSQLGGGTTSNVAGAVGGAVVGGAIGSSVQGSRNTAGVELTVQLDNGDKIAIVQPGTMSDFRIGDRVRVVGNGENTRVNRAS